MWFPEEKRKKKFCFLSNKNNYDIKFLNICSKDCLKLYLPAIIIVLLLFVPCANALSEINPGELKVPVQNYHISDTPVFTDTDHYSSAEGNLYRANYGSSLNGEGSEKEPKNSVSPAEERILTIIISQDEITLAILLYMILIFIMPVTILISYLVVNLNQKKGGHFND